MSRSQRILDTAPVIVNVAAYASTIVGLSRVRQTIFACQKIVAKGYVDVGDVPTYLADAARAVGQVTSAGTGSPAERVRSARAEWFSEKPPAREWFLRDARRASVGVLPQGRVGMLVGAGGAGKTMALAQLAIAVATGGRWLDSLEAREGSVLLTFGEEDEDEVRRRLYNAQRSAGGPALAPDRIVTLPLAGVPCAIIESDARGNPTETAFLWWLRSFVQSIPDLRLIVLDPFARFAGADAEVDNAWATRAVEALESLAVATGATVLAGHHTAQWARAEAPSSADARATAARGVTGLTDGVRWVATLSSRRVAGLEGEAAEHLSDLAIIDHAKSNYGLPWPAIRCRRDRAHGGALRRLDDEDEKIIAAASPPASSRSSKRPPLPEGLG